MVMSFSYSHLQRPVRLSEQTRRLAQKAVNGQFGKELKKGAYAAVIEDDSFFKVSAQQQMAWSIQEIAVQSPVRLVKEELLAGSATLYKALWHTVPVEHASRPGEYLLPGQSHVTPNYTKVLQKGIRGIRSEIMQSLAVHQTDFQAQTFLQSLLHCLDALHIWHDRYIQELTKRISQEGESSKTFRQVLQHLQRVPEQPAGNFREAVQSLWFVFSFLRLCGNWPALGRVDQILWPYLKEDLERGTITLDEAREYLAHFWIKGCEWVTGETNKGNREGSGDGQNYQNVVLAGVDSEGLPCENEVTYLILDVVEELGIADFPIAVRIGASSSRKLVRRVAEVMRYGSGAVAVYNDDVVVPSLIDAGFPAEEARDYANDGCWEVQVPGKTHFCYSAPDYLSVLQMQVLRLGEEGPSNLPYQTFDQLFEAYSHAVQKSIEQEGVAFGQRIILHSGPTLLLDLLVDDCIARAKDYGEGGARYKISSPHAGGLPDVANALQAIRHVVWEKQWMDLNHFMDVVKANWEGQEPLRLYLRNQLVYFGNGNSEADALMQRVYNDYIRIVEQLPCVNGVQYIPGISTFGRQITEEFLAHRTANPDGHKKGEFLANNINPPPGYDCEGATALIRSVCSLGLRRLTGGTALTLKLMPKAVQGEDGLEAFTELLYGFCRLGGHFLQIDVVDTALLREAKEHPEAYQNLVVRVSGWSARFSTLSEEWKEMLIQATEQGL